MKTKTIIAIPQELTLDDYLLLDDGLGRLNVDSLNPTERKEFLRLLGKLSIWIQFLMNKDKIGDTV